MLESVIKSHIKYYPQTLLEECKYEIKKKKMGDLINDFDLNPSDVLDSESDNGSDNRSGSDNDEFNH